MTSVVGSRQPGPTAEGRAPDPVGLRYPRGVRPTPISDRRDERAAIDKWLSACRSFGYYEIGVPALTYAETTLALPGVSAERIYQFDDRGGRRLALVSDALPAWLQAIGQVGNPEITEHRVAYVCPVFRYQKPRRRAFHHMGLGYLTPSTEPRLADLALVEALSVLAEFASACRTRVHVKIGVPAMWHRLFADLRRHPVRPLGRTSREELLAELSSIEDAAELRAIAAAPVQYAPGRPWPPHPADRHITRRDTGAGAAVARAVTALDGPWRLAGEIVRTCPRLSVSVDPGDLHAAEFHEDGVSIQFYTEDGRRLGDGGQYGAYARALLGRPGTCVSLAVGLERLAEDLRPAERGREVMVAVVPAHGERRDLSFDDLVHEAQILAARLRGHGIGAVLNTTSRSVGAARRAARALGLPGLLVVAPWHATAGRLGYHDLRSDAEPAVVSTGQVVDLVTATVAAEDGAVRT